MTQEQIIAIIIAALGSPIIFAVIEYLKDKVLALLRYRGWQAVFLSNGQVYFGKITSVSRNDFILENIFYLANRGENVGYPKRLPNKVKIVKLGDELHGPKDKMTIGRAHILFTENLKDDADVVRAINSYNREQSLANIKF